MYNSLCQYSWHHVCEIVLMTNISKFMIYLFFLFCFVWLLERYWYQLKRQIYREYLYLSKFLLAALGISGERVRQSLIASLVELESDSRISSAVVSGASGEDGSISLPKYKFYSKIVFQMLGYCRNYGISLNTIVQNLRVGIIKDDKFERKMTQQKNGSLFQFIFISFATWFFIFFSYRLIGIMVNSKILIIISLLQSCGIVLFFLVSRYLRVRVFSHFESFFSSLYTLQALSSVGLPINHVGDKAEFEQLFKIDNPKFSYLQRRFRKMIYGWTRDGRPISNETGLLIDELWFLQEQSFEEFQRKQTALKFIVIAVFYLSSYFLFFLSLFSAMVV